MPELSFKYCLEDAKPRTGPGGITRGASVHEFPASVGVAGVSMRLAPGAMRELHWHANAAEWAYVVTGSCRTTVIDPDGTGTIDVFGPGDCWYFPRGFGHMIQSLGPDECHFILIFDNGDFSEDHTFSITDFVAQMPPDVAAQTLNLTVEQVAKLPKGEVYFAQDAVPPAHSHLSNPQSHWSLSSKHRYPLEAQQARRVPGGGTQKTVTRHEFPISQTMSGSVLEIEPGAMREMHWHPNSDEWQYFLAGQAEIGVFLAQGQKVIERFKAGDVGYAPMGAGHYIKNVGDGVLKVLIGFNNGEYQAIDMSEWLRGNPADVLKTNFGADDATVARMQTAATFITPGSPAPQHDAPAQSVIKG